MIAPISRFHETPPPQNLLLGRTCAGRILRADAAHRSSTMLLADSLRRGPARLRARHQHRDDAVRHRVVSDSRGGGLFVGLPLSLLSEEGLFKGFRCHRVCVCHADTRGVGGFSRTSEDGDDRLSIPVYLLGTRLFLPSCRQGTRLASCGCSAACRRGVAFQHQSREHSISFATIRFERLPDASCFLRQAIFSAAESSPRRGACRSGNFSGRASPRCGSYSP